ncbi:hypothetical protein F0226_16885, partial [Vibrio sp. 99-70-13A1]|nr:hypothetical protein [Vibrio sp. 99-70-13A1]
VFHVFYFLAGANFMIIAPYCFYVQRCRTSYLNPSTPPLLLGGLSVVCRKKFDIENMNRIDI